VTFHKNMQNAGGGPSIGLSIAKKLFKKFENI
jgi:hypothetical protein